MTPEYRLRLRRHYGRLGFAIFVFHAVTALLQLGIQAAVLRWAPAVASRDWYIPALSILPMYLVAFPIFLLLLPPAPPRELTPTKASLSIRKLGMLFLMCLGLLYPGNILGQSLDALLSRFLRLPGVDNPVMTVIQRSNLWVLLLSVVLLAPMMEELVFRKLLLDRMRTIDKPSALFYSALTFGLFHGNIVQFFYAFGVGLLFGAIYLKTGRIRYSILLHILVNAAGSLVPMLLLQNMDLADPFRLLVPTILLGCYVLLLLAGCVAGIVLLVKHRRFFRLADGQDLLRPGDRFFLPFLRPGWILFFFGTLALMILALF